MQRNSRIRFTCPNCGDHGLSEAWTGYWELIELTDVRWCDENAQDPCAKFGHGKQTNDGDVADLVGYVCSECHLKVADSEEDLLKWLVENGMLQDDCADPDAGEAQRPNGARKEV